MLEFVRISIFKGKFWEPEYNAIKRMLENICTLLSLPLCAWHIIPVVVSLRPKVIDNVLIRMRIGTHHAQLLNSSKTFTTPCYSSCFHFRYALSTISKRHCYRKTTSRLNKLLLGNLRTNRERVILPSSLSKINQKNTLFIDQSALSNYFPSLLLAL